jgi:hypothetical protein
MKLRGVEMRCNAMETTEGRGGLSQLPSRKEEKRF